MEYRYLGRSGLKVSVLTMGTMTFGGSGKVGRIDAVSQPHLPYPYWHQIPTANDRLGPADRDLLTPYVEEFKRG